MLTHEEISGIIVTLSGENKPYHFTVKAKDERNVNCYFDQEVEDKVSALYKKWVRVVGVISQSHKMCNIETVDYIEMLTSEELHSIGRYKLLQPITFDLSYDTTDSLWCLENHDLALRGYGCSYNDAIQCLEENIEGHVLSFTRFPDSKQSNDSLSVKMKLKEHIDFNQVIDYLLERDGDTDICL
jgi:hypothetical protein